MKRRKFIVVNIAKKNTQPNIIKLQSERGCRDMEDKSLNILICDDSILSRRQMKNMLASITNCNIIEAENGEVAVQKYKKNKIDIVFLDLVMPVKDGITTATELKEYDSDVYMIVVSSVGTQQSIKKALSAGVKDFVQKPIDKTQLMRIVDAFLDGRN